MKITLQDKVIAVTGASSGIGAALSVELAKEGAKVALIGRNLNRLDATKNKILPFTQDVSTHVCDVTQREQVKGTVAVIAKKYGRIDGLVYSSGIGLPTFYYNFESAPIESIHRTNFLGMLYWIEQVAPMMKEQKSGFIVGLSSLAAHLSSKRTTGYTSSKAAVSNFLDGARKGFRKYGIHVLTVEPGYVKTPMTADNEKMIFPMDVDKAARLILKAIKKGKSVYRFPKIMAFFVRVYECLPTFIKTR
ncbi:MAG: SDR family NAD(P)-dependent oxidoreductase [Calditrichaeota bacterium]|nr:SDR family NAD(P)-dependent oxidoreductase [Calditrichota bacterium]